MSRVQRTHPHSPEKLRPVTTITQPLTTGRHLSLSDRSSFQSSITSKASRRHWPPPPPPQKFSLSPSHFCLSLSLLYAKDRKNFTSGFGDGKRVDQELQQLT
ncbi:hypothetical protein P8452_46132 [Trifolium repens]|nr:hypothetical protein P8452_46132 [Trifolium repens]